MEYSGSPNKTIEILNKYGFDFKKRFGQNFLIDKNILENIVEKSNITKEDLVIEIGPGIGSLSQYISDKCGHLVCIEIDKTLIPILEYDTLKDRDNVEIINKDFLNVDINEILKGYNKTTFKVVANLPYYITTPIIMKLLEEYNCVESITVMVQKEVGDRLKATPGSKSYGALSIVIDYYADCEKILDVNRNSFMPKPNVDSIVVKINKRQEKKIIVKNEKDFFKFCHGAFENRRKTLINSLSNSNIGYSKEDIREALIKNNISENIRGEALNLEEFSKLFNTLNK